MQLTCVPSFFPYYPYKAAPVSCDDEKKLLSFLIIFMIRSYSYPDNASATVFCVTFFMSPLCCFLCKFMAAAIRRGQVGSILNQLFCHV